ncbi:heavy-metal-associated domain-containing protein [Clostridium cellulovorans]|uniref:HMA domain-containing protein n=1 Tax=Clostridium cellulovorans (strain ATCC 35296 / DSM 3052 / OCM 3 / 743B) TaxID=573061 RepID=D9SQZ3_CLOC7|nr:heavy metal-associated domain-containing protein [Clostridium cellulovorans]ADL50281.1 hypothetical protein Clocel_0506 [Clostridium cellulovorans 743B]
MQREHYLVKGLANENMKTQVRNALEDLDGVNKVCIDAARGSIEVIYKNPATTDEIRNAIERTGNIIES